MKNFLLICAFVFASFNAHAQNNVAPLTVTIPQNNFVIASLVASNNDVFVFTAPESGEFDDGRYKAKGKVTLMHFDANNKLILKKVVAFPMVSGARFMLYDAFQVGQQIVAIGTAEDNNGKCVSAYVTIDMNTLVAGKKVTHMLENKFEISFGLVQSRNTYSFSQSAPGKALGVYIDYTSPKQKASQYSPRTVRHSAFFIIDEAAALSEVLKYDRTSEETDKTHRDFIMGNDGNMYILTSSYPHYEYDWEAHKVTESSKTRMINGEYKSTLTIYNLSSETKKSVDINFSDSTLMVDDCSFNNSQNGVYLTGSCTDASFNYRQYLKGDTADLLTSQYLFSKLVTGAEMTISNEELGRVDGKQYEELTKEKTITESDRQIGNEENVSLISCTRLEDGTVVITYGVYVYWNWPPYEEIKNDSRYTFEKNDEGRIVSTSGPGGDRKVEFKSLLTMKYKPGTKDVLLSTKQITLNMTIDFMSFRPDMSETFFGRTADSEFVTYFIQPQGSSSRMLSSSPSRANDVLVTSSKKLTIARSSAYTIRNSVLVISGQGEFQIIRLGAE